MQTVRILNNAPNSIPDVIEIEPDYPEDDFDWQSYYYPEECIDDHTIDESGGFINKDNWEPDLCRDLEILKSQFKDNKITYRILNVVEL